MTVQKPEEKPKLVPKKMETDELFENSDDAGCKRELLVRCKEAAKEAFEKVYK